MCTCILSNTRTADGLSMILIGFLSPGCELCEMADCDEESLYIVDNKVCCLAAEFQCLTTVTVYT